jgi:hypothetical protein
MLDRDWAEPSFKNRSIRHGPPRRWATCVVEVATHLPTRLDWTSWNLMARFDRGLRAIGLESVMLAYFSGGTVLRVILSTDDGLNAGALSTTGPVVPGLSPRPSHTGLHMSHAIYPLCADAGGCKT